MGFFKSKGKDQVSTSTVTPNVPQWYKDMLQSSMSEAEQLSNRSVDQIVAGFTPDELASFDAVRNQQGVGQAELAQSSGALQALLSRQTNPSDYRKFMDPYQENVTNIGIRDLVRNADIQRQRLNSQSQMNRSFGGSRSAIQAAELDKNLNQNVGDLSYKGSSDAFRWANDMALRDRTTDVQNTLAAAQGLTNNAGAQANMAYRDAQALNTAGTQQRTLEQARLDAPQAQTTWFQSLLNQFPQQTYGTTTTSVTPGKEGAGWGSKLLGAGLTAAGIFTGNPALMSAGVGSMFGGGAGGSMPTSGFTGLSSLFGGTPSGPMTTGGAGITPLMPGQDINSWLKQGQPSYVGAFADGGPVQKFADGGVASMDWFKKLNAFADKGLNKYNREGSLLGSLLDGSYRTYDPENRLQSIAVAPAQALAGVMAMPGQALDYSGGLLSGLGDYLTKPYSVQEAEAKAAKALEEKQKAEQAKPVTPTVPPTPVEQVVSTAVSPVIQETQNKANPTTPSVESSFLEKLTKAQGTDAVDAAKYDPKMDEKKKWNPNMPLLMAGLAMMASDKPFFEAVGEGGLVGASQYDKQTVRENEAAIKNKELEALQQKAILEAAQKQQEMSNKQANALERLGLDARRVAAYESSVQNQGKGNPEKAHQEAMEFARKEADNWQRAASTSIEGMRMTETQRRQQREQIFNEAYQRFLNQKGTSGLAPMEPPALESSVDEVDYSTLP